MVDKICCSVSRAKAPSWLKHEYLLRSPSDTVHNDTHFWTLEDSSSCNEVTGCTKAAGKSFGKRGVLQAGTGGPVFGVSVRAHCRRGHDAQVSTSSKGCSWRAVGRAPTVSAWVNEGAGGAFPPFTQYGPRPKSCGIGRGHGPYLSASMTSTKRRAQAASNCGPAPTMEQLGKLHSN